MSMSKSHVILFFERNPALRAGRDEMLARIPESDWISEEEVKIVLGEDLFAHLEADIALFIICLIFKNILR